MWAAKAPVISKPRIVRERGRVGEFSPNMSLPYTVRSDYVAEESDPLNGMSSTSRFHWSIHQPVGKRERR